MVAAMSKLHPETFFRLAHLFFGLTCLHEVADRICKLCFYKVIPIISIKSNLQPRQMHNTRRRLSFEKLAISKLLG